MQNLYKNPCRFYSVVLRREAVPYVRDTQQRTEEQPEHLIKSHTFMFYLRDFKRTFLTNICYFNVAVGLGKLWASFQIRGKVLITYASLNYIFTLLWVFFFNLCQHYLVVFLFLFLLYSLEYANFFVRCSNFHWSTVKHKTFQILNHFSLNLYADHTICIINWCFS